MRSLFTKMLLWCFATLILCLAGSMFTGQFRHFTPGHQDFFSRSLAFHLASARLAYDTGGPAGLQQYFQRLKEIFPGNYALLDERGRDLITGKDRCADVRTFSVPRRWRVGHDPIRTAFPSPDHKYLLLVDSIFPPGPPNPIPYYSWIVVATVVFCYILAVQIGSPLRALGLTVERFGRGDLEVRAKSTGKDDFAKLARTFNLMADRIQLLLNAERRLLQDVSHELRSPLARLKFSVELARTSDDRIKSLNRIEREVDRLTELVSELLQVTRAESDPQSRNFVELSLSDLVNDVVDDGAIELEARNCHVKLAVEEDINVVGDRELLRRAIENVFRNAMRYAPEGSDIDVRLRKNDGQAAVTVRDQGPGVPEAALENLFKPFFRVEADRNRSGGVGFGLGLSIAERAVAVHSGFIRAQNVSPGLAVEIVLPTEVPGQSPVQAKFGLARV